MNVGDKTLVKIQDMGLDPYWVLIMYHMKHRSPLIGKITGNGKARGIVNLMVTKGYITKEGMVTERGEQLLSQVEAVQPPPVNIPAPVEVKADFDSWVEEMLPRLKSRLKELTGREQAKGFGDKPFMPNLVDLKGALQRYRTQYRSMFDMEKIERMLIAHIESCYRTRKYTPILQYYIIHKDRGSDLASNYDSFGEKKVEAPVTYTHVDIEDNAINI